MSKDEIFDNFLHEAVVLSNEADKLLQITLYGNQWTVNEEDIHNLRVIFRQFISIHEFYELLLDKKMNTKQRKMYQNLLRALGPQRKTDVYKKLYHQFEEHMKNDDNHDVAKEKKDQVLDALVHQIQKKNKLHEDVFLFRMMFYRAISVYIVEPKYLLARDHKFRKVSLQDFISNRFEQLMKQNKKLEREAQRGDDEKIHALRIQGKTVYYNLKIHKELLRSEETKQMERLKKLHDVTGKLHDLAEIMEEIRKMKKIGEYLEELEEMEKFFAMEKKSYFREFLKIASK